MESEAMAFNKCPIEINQMIALNLSDRDVGNFRLICISTNDAIDADHDRFWFYRFREHFDPPRLPHANHSQTKQVYQTRRYAMNGGMNFIRGYSRQEKAYLQVVKDIIVDARPVVDESCQPAGLNITALKQVIRGTNLLDCIFSRTTSATNRPRSANDLLPLIQLVLSSQALRFDCGTVRSFEESQRAAYLAVSEAPLFTGFNGTDVNVEWALHMVNFFRYHMLRKDEQTLYDAWQDISKKSGGLALPQLWKEQLSDADRDAPMGKEWKGTYAYLERQEIVTIRRGHNPKNIYQDKNVDAGTSAIQRLHIDFPEGSTFPWPKLFEDHLNSVGFHKKFLSPVPTRTTRAQHSARGPASPPIPNDKTRRFEGSGYDDEEFFGAGWLNPLPPQQGIPGWKRMTMMKFFQDGNGLVDVDALWAYEGVVLPGGQIIVGRWWSPEDPSDAGKSNMYSGPFILWNTDSHEDMKQKKKEAKQIKELGIVL